MSNIIKPKRSNTAGLTPTTSNLSSGELGVNMADQKVYINNGTAVVQIGAGNLSGLDDVNISAPTSGQSLQYNGTEWVNASGSGSGDVVGGTTSTDNALVRYDGTTGKLIQNGVVTQDDNGTLANVNAITLDTTPTSVPTTQGTMFWDSGNGTPSIVLNADVDLQVGQEMLALVYNGSGSTITNGSVVAVSGAQGQRPSVVLADADSESLSAPTLGIATEDIANGAEGFVTTFGFVRGLNTSAFTAGLPIYLSQTAGQFTQTRPSAPAHTVALGWVIKVNASSGEVFVNINNGWELDELHNVLITSPTSGNTLIYDASVGVWKNANITGGTGLSVTNGAGTIALANTGVTSAVAGTGISVSGATGAVTITNSGVTSITGTANEVDVSASTGGVTISLPATINANLNGNASTATTATNQSGGTVSATTGSFSGQITSTVATGTAPMVVSSTTKVANLNVEQVDGYHADTANTASTIAVRDASKNLSVSGVALAGSTSGTTTLVASATAGTTTATLPATTGTLITTGDTGTVTNTMLAGSIANNKLANSSITINGSAISLGGSTSVGTVTSVSGTAPISVATGTTTPAISISQASSTTNGYLSSTDWNTFNNKTSNTGTVTSVSATVPTGLSISGSPITTSGTLAITYTAGYSIPTTASQTNWDTAYSDRLKWDGGSTGLVASTGRTSLGGTTVGQNFFTLTNPTAVTFPRINADNTVSALDASTFRSAIGAGTGSGTVTSVTGGSYLTGGTITTSGTLAVDATSANTASKVVARDASGNFSAGTITATLSGNASTSTSTPKVSTSDLRSTALTPSYFGQGLNTAFMANSTDGLNDGGTYHGVIQFQQWSDASGGGSAEIAITDNNNVWHRGSNGALTSWSTWYKFLDTGNYNSYSPTLTGTGASGTWGINISGNASTATTATTANALNTSNSYTAVAFTATSDESVKTNWRDLPTDFIDNLANVKHGIYDRTDIELTQVGASAQSLQKVISQAVIENDNGLLSISYGNVALVACIELAKQVVELKKEIQELKNK